MDERSIGVFDSGLGGLTAVRQLRRLLPGENIVYFGDTGRVPYGPRSPQTIRQYARQDIAFLLSRKVRFLLAACGTVSSTFPPEEAAALPMPFLGVVEPAAQAAAAATCGKVGIIGTQATIRSGSFAARLEQLVPGVQLFQRACPMFVPLVENGYVRPGDPVARLIAHEYLDDLRAAGVDTLILGCTHFPLLEHAIREVMGPDVTLIDIGSEAAGAVKAALEAGDLLSSRAQGSAEFYVSDSTSQFEQAAQLFLGQYAGGSVEHISIEEY